MTHETAPAPSFKVVPEETPDDVRLLETFNNDKRERDFAITEILITPENNGTPSSSDLPGMTKREATRV